MKKIKKAFIKKIFIKRKQDSHKGDYGHSLIVAGSKECMGAAVIASRACLRSGTGLLTVLIPKDFFSIIQISIPEAMVLERSNKIFSLEKYSAIGIGPGLGLLKNEKETLIQILKTFKNSIVIDADALNIIAANKSLIKLIPEGSIITPHPKEFERLFGKLDKENAQEIVTAKAKELKIIIVLKGHQTIISNGDETFINTTGNAGLAKGGSGDALTGIITAFLSQGYTSLNAAILGVFIHGYAADITLEKQSVESMLITDVIENLGMAFNRIS